MAVEGPVCERRIQEGSGFVVADTDLVVTNAHVVGGHERTIVRTVEGTVHDATVVAFDPGRDLAVLRVDALSLPGLPLSSDEATGVGGVYGYPHGGDLVVTPYAIESEITAVGLDLYDSTRISRQVYRVAANIEQGFSGAPLVNPEGVVVGVVFAAAHDRDGVGYALTGSEVAAVLGGDLSTPTGTGPCLS